MPASRNLPLRKTKASTATINGSVEKSKRVVAEVHSDQTLEQVVDGGGQVEVMVGFTEGLGEFNFAKLHVVVRRPCFPTKKSEKEQGRKAYHSADELLEEFRGLLLANIEG